MSFSLIRYRKLINDLLLGSVFLLQIILLWLVINGWELSKVERKIQENKYNEFLKKDLC